MIEFMVQFFFLSTGFHGIHVLVGTLILIVSLFRIYFYHLSLIHHINYELSKYHSRINIDFLKLES